MKPQLRRASARVWAAEATRHDEVAAEAAVTLVATAAYGLQRPEEGERWGRFAEAILKRMGPGHERLQGWLAHNRGVHPLTEAWMEPRRSSGGDRVQTQGRWR